MRVTREGHLLQLTWMPNFFPVNCYIIEEKDGLTLIDAAMPFSLKGIMDTEVKLNKKLTRIILTHAHDDHIGALDGLKSNFQRLRCTSLSEIRHYYVEIVHFGKENLRPLLREACRRR